MNPLVDECARSARERLENGCDVMKQLLLGMLDSKGRVAEEVHATRKLGKSLRGGFTLFRMEKSAALEIQAVGRLLSGPRDAVSRFNTWNKLAWAEEPAAAAAIGKLLEQQTHSAARRPPPETIEWCLGRVDTALAELTQPPAADLTRRIAAGLKKLEQRTLKRLTKLDHRADEDFHKARKALKAWMGAAGFIAEHGIAEDPTLLELAELLGDENDLATLGRWLDEHGFTGRFVPDLWSCLRKARRRIQRKVIRRATRFTAGAA